MEILNTDLLDEELQPIQVGGEEYLIPQDIPVKLYTKLLKVNKDGDFIDGMEQGTTVLCEIFKT